MPMPTELPIFRVHATSAILFALLAFSGCSSKPSYDSAHLTGMVTIDGQPVQEGKLSFMPTGSARGPVVGGPIVAGRYDCPHVPLGDSRVQIYALKPTGKSTVVMGATIPEMQNIVPEKDRTGIEIKVTGDNPSQNFSLGGQARSDPGKT
jgi:hypothetical protein